MNSRGFTLFTALVAFILILLSILIVQSMVSSERKTTDLIFDIEEQTKMQSIAELNRIDALQAFNYNIRKKIEDWLTSRPGGSPNEYTMTSDKAQDWKRIVKDFAVYQFGGVEGGRETTQLAVFINLSLTSFFIQKNIPGYDVELKINDDTEAGRANLQQALQSAVKKSSENDDFFKVIGCTPEDDPEPGTCIGTFYLVLDFSELSQPEYESLPVIEVRSKSSDAVIQQPVLPRGKMLIYVPIRIFRALAWARKIACNTEECNGLQDYGFLSARVHNELEEIGLGYCDKGFCAPRTDPYSNPNKDGYVDTLGDDKRCIEPSIDVKCSNNMISALSGTEVCDSGSVGSSSGISYTANDARDAMKKFGNSRLCSIAKSGSNTYVQNRFGPDFVLSQNPGTDCPGSLLYGMSATSGKYPSKRLESPKEFEAYDNPLYPNSPGQYQPNNRPERIYNFNYCPVQGFPLLHSGEGGTGLEGGLGLFIGDDGKNSSIPIDKDGLACSGVSGSGDSYLSCSKIDSIEVSLSFVDSNPLYRVDKSRSSNTYSIKLSDNRFQGFTPKWNSGWPQSASCLLAHEPMESTCSADDGWSCVPLYKGGVESPFMRIGTEKSGCRPPA